MRCRLDFEIMIKAMNSLDKFFLRAIKLCLYAVVFAPLLFSADYFFPLIFPKIIFIRLLVELMLVLYIPLAARQPQFRPRWNLFYAAGLIFVVIVFASAIAGIDFNFSFWGNYERMDGIFTWLHFWALVVIAASVLKSRAEWSKVLAFSVLAAILVSVYGFAQKAGAGFVYDSGAGRISSTIGNPGFLAGYLLFNIGFGLLIFFDRQANKSLTFTQGIPEKVRDKILRFGSLLVLPVLLGSFLFSATRGAALGVLAGLMAFAVLIVSSRRTGVSFKKSLAAALALIVLMAAIFLFRNSSLIQNNNTLGRLTSFSLSDSTAQTRLIAWKISLNQLRDDFWLGVGPQKYDYVFNKFFDPRFYRLVGSENWWDRAHNMAVEILVTMGMLGFLAYLAVGLSAIILTWRLRRQGENLTAGVLLSLLVAYFTQNLFIFDSVVSYLVLSLLLGYIISVCQPASSAGPAKPSRFIQYLSRITSGLAPGAGFIPVRAWPIFALLGFLLVAPAAWAGNIKLIRHNRLFLEILTPNEQSWSRKVELFQQAMEISDFDSREVFIRTGYLGSQLAGSGQIAPDAMLSGFNSVLAAGDKIIAGDRKDVRLLSAYGDIVNAYLDSLKRTERPFGQWPDKGERALRQAIALGPGRQQVYYTLANNFLIADRQEEAIAVLEEAKNIAPETAETYWRLALFYAYLGKREQAAPNVREALERGRILSDENEINPIAKVFIETQDYEGLLPIFEMMAVKFNSAASYGKLAALYAQAGKKEEAAAAAREVAKREPSLSMQVEEFIRLVQSGEKTDFISAQK